MVLNNPSGSSSLSLTEYVEQELRSKNKQDPKVIEDEDQPQPSTKVTMEPNNIRKIIKDFDQILKEFEEDEISETEDFVDKEEFEIKKAFNALDAKLFQNLFNKFTISQVQDLVNLAQRHFYQLRLDDYTDIDQRVNIFVNYTEKNQNPDRVETYKEWENLVNSEEIFVDRRRK